jgi:hypothetical protein
MRPLALVLATGERASTEELPPGSWRTERLALEEQQAGEWSAAMGCKAGHGEKIRWEARDHIAARVHLQKSIHGVAVPWRARGTCVR